MSNDIRKMIDRITGVNQPINENFDNVHDDYSSNQVSEGVAVGTRLFGIYSPEEDLLAVHATEQGAEENKLNYEKQHGEGFYVDYVIVQA